MSDKSGGNRVFANSFVKAMWRLCLALRKFHRLTGMLGTGKANLVDVNSDGRCCDPENFSRTHLLGIRQTESTVADARSGLVPVFQRPQWKLTESFRLYRRARLFILAQAARHSSSALLET